MCTPQSCASESPLRRLTIYVFKRIVTRVSITPVNLIAQPCLHNKPVWTNPNRSVGSLTAQSICPEVTRVLDFRYSMLRPRQYHAAHRSWLLDEFYSRAQMFGP
ncbi:hypothetical protein ACN38_g3134 [Penicillium nordicum]|uniref:Uncharacterized protein n=1 Tax=Penicillium nordicum TaxID=229535 RepID=A0A0M9WIA6_9EURO|nr:hypothetical protein ACN38_g3134 [Penicillium nordicum]